MRKLDASAKVQMPSGTHMPRRVVIGAVYDPSGAVGGAIQPVTKAEVTALIKEVKRSLATTDRNQAFWRILHSDMPEAMAFIRSELRDGQAQKHAEILHAMGAVSPPAWWDLAAEHLGGGDDSVSLEAAVALEQMAAPQAVKALEKALSREKDPLIVKELVRALAACGAADARVRAATVKRARTERDELVRLNAIVALGLVDKDPDVDAFLKQVLEGKDDAQRTAAVCAAGLTRDESWIAVLEPIAEGAADEALKDAATRALEVLRGGPIQRLQMPVWTICKDKVPRERTFGRSDS
jgi:HEAT repeat protein